MLLPHTKPTNRTRVTHSRKVIDRAVEKLEGSVSTSCASLVYAGYPYDPYAQTWGHRVHIPHFRQWPDVRICEVECLVNRFVSSLTQQVLVCGLRSCCGGQGLLPSSPYIALR